MEDTVTHREKLIALLKEAGVTFKEDANAVWLEAKSERVVGYTGSTASFVFNNENGLDHVEIWE